MRRAPWERPWGVELRVSLNQLRFRSGWLWGAKRIKKEKTGLKPSQHDTMTTHESRAWLGWAYFST
jgi:hypothetical protein